MFSDAVQLAGFFSLIQLFTWPERYVLYGKI